MLINNYKNQTTRLKLDTEVEINGLVALPALIDPHAHFRVPGHDYKEDWTTAAQAALAGGVTTVFDMPNNSPACVDKTSLKEKKELIDQQLKKINIPLRYHLYLGATPNNINEYEPLKNSIIGIKIFMGSSTGDLLVDNQQDQAQIFQLAAKLGLVVAVHAEDEAEIMNLKSKITNPAISDHSKIRNRRSAVKAVKQAIALATKFGTQLYICHVSTKDEIAIIRQAKQTGIKIFAEVTPHHLFLTEDDYAKLGAKAQMNPPVRTTADQDALWQAINEGIIDTIGTDHAPHTLEEKAKPYPQSPSGVPGIETCLPLLLDAYNQGKITLAKIVELTHDNVNKIFGLTENDDQVLVDLNLIKEVKNESLKTKCGWSPFAGRKLKGWPVYTVLNNKVYPIR